MFIRDLTLPFDILITLCTHCRPALPVRTGFRFPPWRVLIVTVLTSAGVASPRDGPVAMSSPISLHAVGICVGGAVTEYGRSSARGSLDENRLNEFALDQGRLSQPGRKGRITYVTKVLPNSNILGRICSADPRIITRPTTRRIHSRPWHTIALPHLARRDS